MWVKQQINRLFGSGLYHLFGMVYHCFFHIITIWSQQIVSKPEVGLMGAVADAVLEMKGEVIGVIPRSGWVTAERRPDGSH